MYEDAHGDSTLEDLRERESADNSSEKNFRYLTPVLNVLPSHFKISAILGSRSFHFLADPQELKEQVQQLLALRKEAGILERPMIMWEPRPSSCTPANMNAMFEAARDVDVFSPNHVELLALFGHSAPVPFDASSIEQSTLPFVTSGIGATGQGSVIIRAGEQGCFIASSTHGPTWLPAYYEPSGSPSAGLEKSPKQIVDPSGAGDTFLGAFAIGFLDTSSIYDAACYGTIGASFAVEQIGLPDLECVEGEELWNGEDAFFRLTEYRLRLK